MTDTPQPSGRDLARDALAAYKAGRRPGTGTPKPTRPKPVRDNGPNSRDPRSFTSVLAQLAEERGWNDGARGGSILDQFADLCPQYAGHVQAVAYDTERRRLDVRPSSDTYATQLRLFGGQLCRQINDKVGHDAVRSLRVLTIGAVTPARATEHAPAVADNAPTPPPPRAAPPEGYRRARQAHRDAYRPPEGDPVLAQRIREARARQTAALIARRHPPEEHAEYLAQLELQQEKPIDPIEASIQAAIAYKHGGHHSSEPRRAFDAA